MKIPNAESAFVAQEKIRDYLLNAAETFESIHGRKYTLTGRLRSTSGRLPVVQTIWIIDRGEEIPRLVTAYPHEQ